MAKNTLSNDIGLIVAKIAEDYRQNLINDNAVATGNLADFKYSVKVGTTDYLITFELPDYWRYIENGAKYTDKKPPFNAILDWIKVKSGLLPRDIKTGKFLPHRTFAFMVQNAIYKRGLPPRNILQRTLQQDNKLIREIPAKIKNELIDQLKQTIKELDNVSN